MAFLVKLLLCLALIGACAWETNNCVAKFNHIKGSILSFFGAVAWAANGWLWVYLGAVALYTGQFVGTTYINYVAAGCVLAAFVSVSLACYVDFYKDMPKGPTR